MTYNYCGLNIKIRNHEDRKREAPTPQHIHIWWEKCCYSTIGSKVVVPIVDCCLQQNKVKVRV